MKVIAGWATDVGRVRPGNEDSYLVDPPLYAVADGMGGHQAGEVASGLALETMKRLFAEGQLTLSQQVQEANLAVFNKSLVDESMSGMGTTLTVAAVEDGTVRLAHVGDSRAYLLRGDRLHRLTKDHTLVARMVDTGEITEREAEVHPQRNILTRAIGTDDEVRVDECRVEVNDKDRLLLCSDGLTGMVTEGQIGAILGSTDTPQEAADRLVRAANRAGGVDNITAVIVEFKAERDEKTSIHTDPGIGLVIDPVVNGTEDAKSDRTATKTTASTARVTRGVVTVIALASLFLLGLWGARTWAYRQWYLGDSSGVVAIYRGIPGDSLGIQLNSVVYRSEIPTAKAQQQRPDTDLTTEVLSASDEQDARRLLATLCRDVYGEATRADVAARCRQP